MKLPFDTDAGNAARARLGLIVLQSDETIETEFRQALQIPGVALYHSRIRSAPMVTKETLAQMAADLPDAAGLLPNNLTFDAIAYACTSGATVIGQKNVAAKIHQHHPSAPVTDPMTAVMAALKALRIKRIALLTPYVAEVSAAMQNLIETHGFEISGFGSFEQESEQTVARISQKSVLESAIRLASTTECDAIFASCTNLRSFGILAQAEAETGKPVISSNQALLWHLLRLAGVNDHIGSLGKLFSV